MDTDLRKNLLRFMLTNSGAEETLFRAYCAQVGEVVSPLAFLNALTYLVSAGWVREAWGEDFYCIHYNNVAEALVDF